MSVAIKAKVLAYEVFYHGIYCGKAKLKLLEGDNKGEIITIQVTDHYKPGQIITTYETNVDD